jgi:hypothetical protein
VPGQKNIGHPNDKKARDINRVMKRFDLQETLNARFRHVLAFAITAVVIAALLRHTVHVYGGYSPADIRGYALMSIPLVVILLALAKGKKSDN